MTEKKYAYEEPKQALNSRINAHSKYSDFNLHAWIKNRFKIRRGERILDLGCGNGNFTLLFWEAVGPTGFVLGLDKNAQLIEEVKNKHAGILGSHVQFKVHDFDDPLPQEARDFNWVFANYSLYYTENSLKILQAVKNRLTPGGTFVVIGPGPGNAQDLSEFSHRLTGKKPNREHTERIERIAKEFRPLFEKIFGKEHVRYEEIDSVMEFPTAESYAEYYWSTLLWRESTSGRSSEEIKMLQEETLKRVSSSLPARINKQVACLTGRV